LSSQPNSTCPIVQVVEPPSGKDWKGFTDDGIAINFCGVPEIFVELELPTPAAKDKITDWLASKNIGATKLTINSATWLFFHASVTGANLFRLSEI